MAGEIQGADVRPAGDGVGALRVLGIDTSLRGTGLGIVEEAGGGRVRGLAYDVLRNPPGRPLSGCLVHIQDELKRVLADYHPDVVAIEGVYIARFAKTALILGHARGVVVAACAAEGIPVFEYAPRRVKQAIVGYGAATKEQMQAMVARQLGLGSVPPEDAADALALALCHLQSRTRIALAGGTRL